MAFAAITICTTGLPGTDADRGETPESKPSSRISRRAIAVLQPQTSSSNAAAIDGQMITRRLVASETTISTINQADRNDRRLLNGKSAVFDRAGCI